VLTKRALEDRVDPEEIIQKGYIAAMSVVGEKFSKGEIYIPEMLIAARAMKSGLEHLGPLLVGGSVKTIAKVVLGTVKGDAHDIGKNLVGMMLEGSGIKVIDLGTDVAPERFVEAVKVHQPQFVGMSALLTTTMVSMEETITALKKAGVRGKIKILIGGAPVNQKFAEEIEADGFAENAGEAVERIKKLL
jgi:5-methyltetrahydrofolate--homocysteine methyltransferase